jgi:hypothetical protein
MRTKAGSTRLCCACLAARTCKRSILVRRSTVQMGSTYAVCRAYLTVSLSLHPPKLTEWNSHLPSF